MWYIFSRRLIAITPLEFGARFPLFPGYQFLRSVHSMLKMLLWSFSLPEYCPEILLHRSNCGYRSVLLPFFRLFIQTCVFDQTLEEINITDTELEFFQPDRQHRFNHQASISASASTESSRQILLPSASSLLSVPDNWNGSQMYCLYNTDGSEDFHL